MRTPLNQTLHPRGKRKGKEREKKGKRKDKNKMEQMKSNKDLRTNATIARDDLFQLGQLDSEFEGSAVAIALVCLKRLLCHGGCIDIVYYTMNFYDPIMEIL